MSKYTTEVRYICESTAGLTDSAGFNSIDSVLSEETVGKIFNFDYPIFDENYRYPLNKKILRHFYTREIGEESVGLWQLRLQQTLNEIMPYYNKLYKLELENINPFYNVDLTTTGNKDGAGTTAETITNNKTKNDTENTTKNGTNSKTDNETERTQGLVSTNLSGSTTNTGSTSKNSTENNNDRENTINNVTKNKINNENYQSSGGENISKTGTKDTTIDDTKNKTQTTSDKGTTEENTSGTQIVGGTKDTIGSNVNTANSTDRYSDTPQGGLEGMQAIQQNLYLTNARLINSGDTGSRKEGVTTHEETQTSGVKTGKYSDTGKLTEKETDKKKGTEKDNEKTTKSLTNTQLKTLNGNDTENGNKNTTKSGTTTYNERGTKDERGSKSENTSKTDNTTVTTSGTSNGTTNERTNRDGTSTEKTNGNRDKNITSTENYLEHVIGYKGNKSIGEIIIQWRKNLLNIDAMILRDLEDCFFQLW